MAANAASLLTGQPGTTIPSGTWTGPYTTGGYPIKIVGYSNLECASAVKGCYMLENYHPGNSEYQHSMLKFSYSTGNWNVLDQSADWHSDYMWPSSHPVGYLRWNANTNQVYYWGAGAGAQSIENDPYTFWIWDGFGRTGHPAYSTPTATTGAADPSTEQSTLMVYDPVNQVTIFESSGGNTYERLDSTGQWTKITPTCSGSCPPNGAGFPGMAYNPIDQCSYFFGGGNSTGTNGLWKYYQPTHTWTLLLANGTAGNPTARDYGALAWDSRRNLMLLAGGCPGYSTCASPSALTDTWLYNPATNAWTQQSPSASYTGTIGQFYGLSYDETNDAFVFAFGVGSFVPNVWLYRIDPGNNIGYNTYTSASYPANTVSYSLNHSASSGTPGTVAGSDSYARNPHLSVSGSTLSECHAEQGLTSAIDASTWFNAYCQQYGGSLPTATMPSSSNYTSITGSAYTGVFQSTSEVIPLNIGGTEWVAYDGVTLSPNCYNGASSCVEAYTATYSGSAWTSTLIPFDGTALETRPMDFISCNSIPTVALQEIERGSPASSRLWVKQWNGSSWTQLGGAYINRTSSSGQSYAFDAKLACDSGNNVWVTWNEANTASGSWYYWSLTPQVFVSKWNGSTWTSTGTSLNNNTSNWATDPSITVIGTTPYVGWQERSLTGPSLIYTDTWNGSAWVAAGTTPINRNTNTTNNGSLNNPVYPFAWASHVRLINDGTNVWASWTEQQGLSDYSHLYVSEYVPGTGWSAVGGSPIANSDGSSANNSIALLGGAPVVAWDESHNGTLRQVYAAKYASSTNSFASLNSALTTPTISPNGGPFATAQSVSISGPVGATICYKINATPGAATPGTCDGGSTTYSTAFSVSVSETVYALATEAGFTNSSITSAGFTIVIGPTGGSSTSGAVTTGPTTKAELIDLTATSLSGLTPNGMTVKEEKD